MPASVVLFKGLGEAIPICYLKLANTPHGHTVLGCGIRNARLRSAAGQAPDPVLRSDIQLISLRQIVHSEQSDSSQEGRGLPFELIDWTQLGFACANQEFTGAA